MSGFNYKHKTWRYLCVLIILWCQHSSATDPSKNDEFKKYLPNSLQTSDEQNNEYTKNVSNPLQEIDDTKLEIVISNNKSNKDIPLESLSYENIGGLLALVSRNKVHAFKAQYDQALREEKKFQFCLSCIDLVPLKEKDNLYNEAELLRKIIYKTNINLHRKGYAKSSFILALFYLHGFKTSAGCVIVEQDYNQAYDYYKQAAQLKIEFAYIFLCYLQTLNVGTLDEIYKNQINLKEAFKGEPIQVDIDPLNLRLKKYNNNEFQMLRTEYSDESYKTTILYGKRHIAKKTSLISDSTKVKNFHSSVSLEFLNKIEPWLNKKNSSNYIKIQYTHYISLVGAITLDALCNFRLAHYYRDGINDPSSEHNVDPNFDHYKFYLNKAYEQGMKEAGFALGQVYSISKFGPPNSRLSIKLLGQAWDNGCQHILADPVFTYKTLNLNDPVYFWLIKTIGGFEVIEGTESEYKKYMSSRRIVDDRDPDDLVNFINGDNERSSIKNQSKKDKTFQQKSRSDQHKQLLKENKSAKDKLPKLNIQTQDKNGLEAKKREEQRKQTVQRKAEQERQRAAKEREKKAQEKAERQALAQQRELQKHERLRIKSEKKAAKKSLKIQQQSHKQDLEETQVQKTGQFSCKQQQQIIIDINSNHEAEPEIDMAAESRLPADSLEIKLSQDSLLNVKKRTSPTLNKNKQRTRRGQALVDKLEEIALRESREIINNKENLDNRVMFLEHSNNSNIMDDMNRVQHKDHGSIATKSCSNHHDQSLNVSRGTSFQSHADCNTHTYSHSDKIYNMQVNQSQIQHVGQLFDEQHATIHHQQQFMTTQEHYTHELERQSGRLVHQNAQLQYVNNVLYRDNGTLTDNLILQKRVTNDIIIQGIETMDNELEHNRNLEQQNQNLLARLQHLEDENKRLQREIYFKK